MKVKGVDEQRCTIIKVEKGLEVVGPRPDGGEVRDMGGRGGGGEGGEEEGSRRGQRSGGDAV